MGVDDKEVVSLDEALKRVGGYRRWNLIAFLLLGTSSFVPLCWQGLCIVFIGETIHTFGVEKHGHCMYTYVGEWHLHTIVVAGSGHLFNGDWYLPTFVVIWLANCSYLCSGKASPLYLLVSGTFIPVCWQGLAIVFSDE